LNDEQTQNFICFIRVQLMALDTNPSLTTVQSSVF
jgi:hypothetical protein